jgi:D-alanyl-lipoteichoic acid acyltransferase DltB (MBOAT superfamily)
MNRHGQCRNFSRFLSFWRFYAPDRIMLFNSFHFLVFFPIVVLFYTIIPHRFRYLWLLAASYYFYMAWNPKYALLLTASIITTYLSGILINGAREKNRPKLKKLWAALSFILNLSLLFVFKYVHFAVDTVISLARMVSVTLPEPQFDILLPVGISFYTFQALSYTMDIYRGEIRAERNFFKYALFVSFFPQLVAGPIERSKNLLTQIDGVHAFDFGKVKDGLLLMLWGYFQKMVIADRAAVLVNQVFNNWTEYAGFQIIVAAVFFAFQVYCDFAGYSDIAIGAAQVMGFRLMDNFRQPYFASSIQDFWRRWHISLSTWLRDYVYIPLGGSRCSRPRTYFNIMVTFLASGIWHGANWNFVFWGGFHGACQIAGDMLKPVKRRIAGRLRISAKSKLAALVRILWTFLLVDTAWIFFRADGFTGAVRIMQRIMRGFHPRALFDKNMYKLGLDKVEFCAALAAICVLFAANWFQYRNPGVTVRSVLARRNLAFKYAFYIVALFSVLIFGMYGPEYDAAAFIYFQF